MPSVDYVEEKCLTWNSSVAGFAIWISLITTMFLVDAIAYYTAQTKDMVASPNTYVIHEKCRSHEKHSMVGSLRIRCSPGPMSRKTMALSNGE